MRMKAPVLAILLAAFVATGTENGGDEDAFPDERIEQLVAPIALHPDDLVSQILMASTYPLEVVQASRWYRDSVKLEGEALATALKNKSWDPSVKSLVNVPDVLAMMNKRLDWTQNLGNAYLADPDRVMAAIQRLRAKAKDAGNLDSSKEVKVEERDDSIVIEPADPDVIYVPVYDPTIVYGTWPYPRWRPWYWYPPGWRPRPVPYAFGAGLAVGVAWGYAWGRCDWRHARVDIDISRNAGRNANINREKYRRQYTKAGVANGKGAWKHDATHRQGVRYPDARTAQRYGRGVSPKAASRQEYRGRRSSMPSRAQPSRAPERRPSSARRSSPGGFHHYQRGTQVQRYSQRGHASRRTAPRPAPRGGARGGGRR